MNNYKNKFDNNLIYYYAYSLPMISKDIFLQTTKYFLESFKFSKKVSLLSKDFMNTPLYSKESQIPDTYEALQKKFDRNNAFFIRNKPYTKNSYYQVVPKNLYPKIPLKLKPCELTNNNNKNAQPGDIKKEQEKYYSFEYIYDGKMYLNGPFNSWFVLEFIKNKYNPMSDEEKNKMNLLIIDIVSDIHYKPDALYQIILDEQKDDKNSGDKDKKDKTD